MKLRSFHSLRDCWTRTVLVLAPLVLGIGAAPSIAADLDVRIVDGQISIAATAAPLAELLGMLDRVAGTESSVVPALRNRNVSVRFSGLSLDEAVDKIFEGAGLDYVVVGGRRIMVMAVSGVPPAGNSSVATQTANPFQVPQAPDVAPNPVPTADTGFGRAQEPPSVIQSPFGPIVNPAAAGRAQPSGPLSLPGQGARQVPQNGNSAVPLFSQGVVTGSPAPGQPANVFDNTSPQILDLNKQQSAPQPQLPGSGQKAPGLPFPPANPGFPPKPQQ